MTLAMTGTPCVADEFSDGMFTPRVGGYVAGTIGYAFEYEIIGNDVTGSSNELSYDMDREISAYTGSIGSYLGQSRLELELGFRDAEFDNFNSGIPGLDLDLDGDLEYYTIMGNIYWDIPTAIPNLELYLGGGAGLAIVRGDVTYDPAITIGGGFGSSATTEKFDDTAHTFTYQFMGGLAFRVLDHVTLTGGYRIRLFSEFSDDNSLLIFREHEVHAIEVGVRIDF